MRSHGIWILTVGMVLAVALPGWGEPERPLEVEVLGVGAEPLSQQPYVVMREKAGRGVVEMFIGTSEAQAIALALNRQTTPRPLTHDLMFSLMKALQARLRQVLIHDLKENTYYAQIWVQTREGEEIYLDSRPSDAIALALRAGAPIFVRPFLLKQPSSPSEVI